MLDIDNGNNDGILLKEGTYYRIGIIYYTTNKHTLGILLCTYDTLGVHLVDRNNDRVLLKQ